MEIQVNPFIRNFKLDVLRVHNEFYESKTSDVEDGFISKYRTVRETRIIEKQKKVSVYNIPFIENVLFGEMSSSGRDMLLYVIYNIKKDIDYINLPSNKVCKEMRIGKTTYYRAIEQLVCIGLVIKKIKSEYWVNPMYLFNGSRLDYFNKHCPECINTAAELKA